MTRVGEDNDFSLRNYLEALCLQSPIKKKPQNTFYLPLFQFLPQHTVLKQYPGPRNRNELDNINNLGNRICVVHKFEHDFAYFTQAHTLCTLNCVNYVQEVQQT